MKFDVPPTSRSQQADLLIERGLTAEREELIFILNQVGFTRLRNYLGQFEHPGDESGRFVAGATLEAVWDAYVFDRQLRLHILDAIERIEVAIKAQLSNTISIQSGPFGHLDPSNWSTHGLEERYPKFVDKLLAKEAGYQDEKTLKHWRSAFSSEEHLPIWLACEIMDFGCMLTLFRGCSQRFKQQIASNYAVSDNVLESWLIAINTVRNMCAHHSRIWNRSYGITVKIPNKDLRWKEPVQVNAEPRKNFAFLTILRYLLFYIAPHTGWAMRLEDLWKVKHPNIPLQKMGFPANWKECPIWHSAS